MLTEPFAGISKEDAQQDMIILLTRLLRKPIDSPRGFDRLANRSRITAAIESGTITTVTTVSNIANQTLIGGVQAAILPSSTNGVAIMSPFKDHLNGKCI